MMSRKEPRLPCFGSLRIFVVMLVFFPACSNPDDPQSVDPPPSTDFFPSLAVGDTMVWDYLHYTLETGSLRDYLTGRMEWTVTAVESGGDVKVTTVRQIFRGLLTTGTPVERDSIWIPADTTVASTQEDANHTITVTTQAVGRYTSYGGRPVSFPRYPTGVQGDTLQVAVSYAGGGYGNTVRAKRAFGLIYYYDWSGPGMTQVRTSMTRR